MDPRALLLTSILLLPLVLAGCTRGDEAEAQQDEGEAAAIEQAAAGETPAEIGFSAQVAPIFAAKCNSCHHPDNAVKVDLTRPFDPELGLIDRPNSWTRSSRPILVVPGDPEASALIWKVEQTELEPKIDGDPMPWHIDPLTGTEIESLRAWIEGGAEDDSAYRGTIKRILGDGVSLGSRGGKCAYCHHPAAAYGPDLTDLFDPERGSVNIASDFGGVRIVPGDADASVLYLKVKGEPQPAGMGLPMPLHYGRLTPDEILILRDWISQGAKNN